MTLNLPNEMRQALAEHPEQPLHVVDAETQQTYVLLPTKAYEQFRLFPLIHAALQQDWDAPGMDAYENYDEARQHNAIVGAAPCVSADNGNSQPL